MRLAFVLLLYLFSVVVQAQTTTQPFSIGSPPYGGYPTPGAYCADNLGVCTNWCGARGNYVSISDNGDGTGALTCTVPPVTCTAPLVRDPATNTCVSPPPTCVPPQVLNAATHLCETPPSNCPSAGTSGGVYRYTTASTVGTPTTYAEYDGECVLREVDRFCTSDGTGIYHCVAKTEYTGNPCPPGGCDGAGTDVPPPAPQPDPSIPPNAGPCQPGYYYGTVNGQTVCVPGQSTSTSNSTSTTTTGPSGTVEKSQTTVTTTNTSPNGTKTTQTTQTTLEQQWSAARQITHQSEVSFPSSAIPATAGETKTSTVTNSDGSKTEYTLTKNEDGTVSGTARDQNTVDKTESTTCTGSACTVTSTTTTNGTPTGSTTGTTSKDGLCKDSPDNAQCGDGGGSWAGTCESGFICEGDPVQCAISRELHTRQCQLYNDKDGDATRYADAVSGADGKSAQALKDAAAAGASNIGVFNTSGYGWGRSCPADPHIPLTWVSGGELVIPFSRICGPLGLLAAGAVAMNLLGCMVFVVRT